MLTSRRPPIGSEVEVRANSVTYRGKLLEISETDVTLRTLVKTMSIPLNRIQSIKPTPVKPAPSLRTK